MSTFYIDDVIKRDRINSMKIDMFLESSVDEFEINALENYEYDMYYVEAGETFMGRISQAFNSIKKAVSEFFKNLIERIKNLFRSKEQKARLEAARQDSNIKRSKVKCIKRAKIVAIRTAIVAAMGVVCKKVYDGAKKGKVEEAKAEIEQNPKLEFEIGKVASDGEVVAGKSDAVVVAGKSDTMGIVELVPAAEVLDVKYETENIESDANKIIAIAENTVKKLESDNNITPQQAAVAGHTISKFNTEYVNALKHLASTEVFLKNKAYSVIFKMPKGPGNDITDAIRYQGKEMEKADKSSFSRAVRKRSDAKDELNRIRHAEGFDPLTNERDKIALKDAKKTAQNKITSSRFDEMDDYRRYKNHKKIFNDMGL